MVPGGSVTKTLGVDLGTHRHGLGHGNQARGHDRHQGPLQACVDPPEPLFALHSKSSPALAA